MQRVRRVCVCECCVRVSDKFVCTCVNAVLFSICVCVCVCVKWIVLEGMRLEAWAIRVLDCLRMCLFLCKYIHYGHIYEVSFA